MTQAVEQKPTSITVIGVLIMLLGAFNGLGALGMFAMRDDPAFQRALEASAFDLPTLVSISLAGAATMIVAGFGVLKGANWGRWLYVLYSAAGIALGLLTGPGVLQVLPGILIFAVFAFFLFQPAADAYFKRARR